MRESSSSLVIASASTSCSLRSAKRFIAVSRWSLGNILQFHAPKCEAWCKDLRSRIHAGEKTAAPPASREPMAENTTAPSASRGRRKHRGHLWGDAPRPLLEFRASRLVLRRRCYAE